MSKQPEVTVTEDDRRTVDDLWQGCINRRLSETDWKERIALALAETRERAKAHLKQIAKACDEAECQCKGFLERIAELQAKLEASRDCSGRYHKRIADLEAENARLQQFLDRLLTACMFADEGDHLPLQDARKAGERILAEHRRATS